MSQTDVDLEEELEYAQDMISQYTGLANQWKAKVFAIKRKLAERKAARLAREAAELLEA